jgi:hypothetical protein
MIEPHEAQMRPCWKGKGPALHVVSGQAALIEAVTGPRLLLIHFPLPSLSSSNLRCPRSPPLSSSSPPRPSPSHRRQAPRATAIAVAMEETPHARPVSEPPPAATAAFPSASGTSCTPADAMPGMKSFLGLRNPYPPSRCAGLGLDCTPRRERVSGLAAGVSRLKGCTVRPVSRAPWCRQMREGPEPRSVGRTRPRSPGWRADSPDVTVPQALRRR